MSEEQQVSVCSPENVLWLIRSSGTLKALLATLWPRRRWAGRPSAEADSEASGCFHTPHQKLTLMNQTLNSMQTVGAVAEGDGKASGCFEATLGALAALREGLTEERSLLRRYKALTWGRVLSPMQVRRPLPLVPKPGIS